MTLPINNRIAIYVRVSSEEQVNGFSIDAQLEALRAYAHENGLSIYREYVDAGFSGKSIDGREAMKQLLEDAKRGRFQYVASWKLNRMGRNMIDILSIMELFKQHQIKYVSLTEQFHSDTTHGNLTLQMLGAIAQLEREQIAQNVRLGMKERHKHGKWNSGNNVLGYSWIQGTTCNDSYVKVLPEEAELVRSIFEQYKSGAGLKAITNRLNAAGYRTKLNKPFGISSVRGILTNVNYIGQIRYTDKDERGKPVSHVVDGDHEAIIDKSLWDDVQLILERRTSIPKNNVQRTYLLSGLLKCPMCGSSMVPSHVTAHRKNGSSKTNFYYVCGNWNNKGSSVCKTNAIPAPGIEEHVLSKLEALLSQRDMLTKIISRIRLRQAEAYAPGRQKLAETTARIKETETQIQRCFEMFEDGLLKPEEIAAKITPLHQAHHDLLAEKQAIESDMLDNQAKAISASQVSRALSRLFRSLQKEKPHQRNTLLRGFIHSIHIPPNRNPAEAIIIGTEAIQKITL